MNTGYLSISLYHIQFPSLVFYSFQSIDLSPSCLSLFLDILFILMQFKSGFFFLLSLSDSSLLVYRNATDFCMLILYPATLLNSLSVVIVFRLRL